MALMPGHTANFDTLVAAISNDDAALMECKLKSTGESVAVICAVNRDGEDLVMVPMAMLFNGDPYELLEPPA